MTTAQVVETSVTVNDNSPIQDYVNPDDQTQPTFEMTPGFKPFTLLGLLPEAGKKNRSIADRRVPSNDPRKKAGHSSAPFSFSFQKRQMIRDSKGKQI